MIEELYMEMIVTIRFFPEGHGAMDPSNRLEEPNQLHSINSLQITVPFSRKTTSITTTVQTVIRIQYTLLQCRLPSFSLFCFLAGTAHEATSPTT